MTRKTKKTDKRRSGTSSRKAQVAHEPPARVTPSASSTRRGAPAAPDARDGGAVEAAARSKPHSAPHHTGTPGRSRAARKAAAVQASAVRLADPFYERETQQYDNPLPSREYVLQILAERGVPMPFSELAGALDIAPHELDFFDRRLRAMERDGQVVRNRREAYLLPAKADLIKGRVEGHPDGFGFLRRDDGEPDVFLGPKEMREVLHGDRVMVRISGTDRRGRPEGKLVEVLERANNRVVGRVINEHGVMIVVPENRRLAQDILVAPGGRKKPEPGQIVTVELVEQPTKFAQPIGRIVEVLGNYADPGMEIEIALRKHDLPYEFSSEAKAQTRKLPDVVRKKDWAGREDLTKLPLVTIDGETARDFDDAVYCERQGKGYRLIVAIADVSFYVRPNSALDREARKRGNSVYFPDRVVPMLPEILSADVCSLKAGEDRAAMVCHLQITKDGALKSWRFSRGRVRIRANIAYEDAQAMIDGAGGVETASPACAMPEIEGTILDQLKPLWACWRALAKARDKRNPLELDLPERRVVLDEKGRIASVAPRERLDAHRLIEEYMIAANVAAAKALEAKKLPVMYRVHEPPSREKLVALKDYLKTFEIEFALGQVVRPATFNLIIERVGEDDNKPQIMEQILRTQTQAYYGPDNHGHFGLALGSYAHFTSPIRRYADLVVHRALVRAYRLEPEVKETQLTEQEAAAMDVTGELISQHERRAMVAERETMDRYVAAYLSEQVGALVDCRITGVQSFGFFATVEGLGGDGLVPVSTLGQEYFRYEEARQALVGENSGETYESGQRLKLRLAEADPVSGSLRFELPDAPSPLQRERGGPVRDGRRSGPQQGRRGRPSNIRHQGRKR